jgi:hypothetical protein
MAEVPKKETILIRYKFHFADNTEKQFDIVLNAKTLEFVHTANASQPEWTHLKYHQCVNCPLDESVEYCPVAVNISDLIDEFKFATSYDKTWVVVETAERTYASETTVQNGVSAILGIYMTISHCPVMDHLRPMVRFHLPFATAHETVFRAVSMFLIAQYFRQRKGLAPDWTLEKLVDIYKEVGKVNKGMWNRLSNASSFDANVNALIVLSNFGDALRYSIKKELEEFEPFFAQYFDEEK